MIAIKSNTTPRAIPQYVEISSGIIMDIATVKSRTLYKREFTAPNKYPVSAAARKNTPKNNIAVDTTVSVHVPSKIIAGFSTKTKGTRNAVKA